ncbi:hypothetical protein H9L01_10300 [Erysipelothrix inopinata]|uniref:Uncharacterized protein n=1 Tax=Erysipelothrix inopinata TaxID=225084 RepID=A0A7G9RYR3_9FIRM|nr:hypothetical protein [Erysipelothrix inopinata]QNN60738.1 hypothetical protein H9L01_10300 [Erysipelothrix inopinata]
MKKKYLVLADGEIGTVNLENYLTYDLRQGHKSKEIMDIYEVENPALCSTVREWIISHEPDAIIVVGRSEEYLWVATIVARLFGQFNSWNEQRSNPFGKTVIKVAGKDVELIAIESLSDWGYVDETLR